MTPVTASDSRKSKMVSFRLSSRDYLRFREVCEARGVQSISALARVAMENFASSAPDTYTDALPSQIHELRTQVRTLALEVDRLTMLVQDRKAGA